MGSNVVKPLSGVRVLDFSRVLAGPFCTAMMSDMGAEIIKIEAPSGDDQRWMGAFKNDASISFELINRNKRSLKLDLKQPEALQIIYQLVAQCDVVVENFRPGVAAKLGIDYATLKQHNDQLVYCSISGFGQQGPMASFPSYDVVAQALSGLMSITGQPDGEPVLVGDSVGDTVSGLFAAWGISSALFQRSVTGQGAYLDVAMFDSLFALLPTALANWQVNDVAPGRHGSHHPLSAPFGTYLASDGEYMLAIANNSLFSRFAKVLGQEDLAVDTRFSSDQQRRVNRDALQGIIQSWSAGKTTAQVLDLLQAAGIPCSNLWDVAQAAQSDHAQHRQLMTEVDHDVFGRVRLPEQPVVIAGMARGQVRRAPKLGEDSDAILAGLLNMDEHAIQALKDKKII